MDPATDLCEAGKTSDYKSFCSNKRKQNFSQNVIEWEQETDNTLMTSIIIRPHSNVLFNFRQQLTSFHIQLSSIYPKILAEGTRKA